MSEVIIVLVGVVVGAFVGYFPERASRRVDRRRDAYIEALATLQTARDAYGRRAGLVGEGGGVEVAPDHALNRVLAGLEHDGSPDAVAAYIAALHAASKVHEAMLRPVRDPDDREAGRQHLAVKEFGLAVKAFADVTVPRLRRRWWQRH